MEKKRTLTQMIVCIGLVCIIWVAYFLVKHYGVNRILEVKEDDFSWLYQVDSMEIGGEYLVLEGFAFEMGVDAKKGAYEIVLQDIESQKTFFLDTEYEKRFDVNEYFSCEKDYSMSGFVSQILLKKIDLYNETYEILLRVKGDRLAYCTGIYISNGKLMYVNPAEYSPLDVEGTVLEKVVENGFLRVYKPEYGMYVYQYEGMIYWIAENGHELVEDDTPVPFQLFTTQAEKIPRESPSYESGIDNIGFLFYENEWKDESIEGYRVARETLPTGYSIVKVLTGHHDNNDWIWREYFRPIYQLQE